MVSLHGSHVSSVRADLQSDRIEYKDLQSDKIMLKQQSPNVLLSKAPTEKNFAKKSAHLHKRCNTL